MKGALATKTNSHDANGEADSEPKRWGRNKMAESDVGLPLNKFKGEIREVAQQSAITGAEPGANGSLPQLGGAREAETSQGWSPTWKLLVHLPAQHALHISRSSAPLSP